MPVSGAIASGVILTGAVFGGGNECAVPQPYCAPQTCAPSAPATATAPARGQEFFIRGPASGTAAGESNGFGIRGPVLHVPEMRIALPHLELPSLFKTRHDAVKTFHASTSPLSGDASVILNNSGTAPAIPPSGTAPAVTPPCQPYCPPACAVPTQCANLDEQLQTLQAKIEQLEELERRIARLKELPPEPQASHNNGMKPVMHQQQVDVPASRPVAASRTVKLQTASYEEVSEPPVVVKRAPAASPNTRQPAKSPSKFGLSSPSDSKRDFGDWNAK